MSGRGIWATLDPFVEGGAVMGRKTANVGFLRALLERDAFEGYQFFLAEESRLRELEIFLEREYPDLLPRVRLARRLDLPQALTEGGQRVFHLSDCINQPADLV